jgi:hypothetical protein
MEARMEARMEGHPVRRPARNGSPVHSPGAGCDLRSSRSPRRCARGNLIRSSWSRRRRLGHGRGLGRDLGPRSGRAMKGCGRYPVVEVGTLKTNLQTLLSIASFNSVVLEVRASHWLDFFICFRILGRRYLIMQPQGGGATYFCFGKPSFIQFPETTPPDKNCLPTPTPNRPPTLLTFTQPL